MLLPGPCGCLQQAPCFQLHHWAALFRATALLGGANTNEDAANSLSPGFGVPGGNCFFNSSQSMFLSAVVMYDVAFTNFSNCALVTSVTSIQKLSSFTRCCGYSSGFPSLSGEPARYSPPGTSTMPSSEVLPWTMFKLSVERAKRKGIFLLHDS